MSILHITIQAPGYRSGGEICVRQTLLSLVGCGYAVDYLGPEIKEPEIRDRYRQVYELPAGHNTLLRVWDTIHGITNQRYRSWLELSRKFDFSRYDAIVMDFTKLDYVLEKAPCEKVIVRAHNVEADYSARNYEFHRSFANYLDKVFAARREAEILRKVKRLVVLTPEDASRFGELYDLSGHQVVIDPICIEGPRDIENASETDTYSHAFDEQNPFDILLTGSLWFGPNYEGVKWFLKEVYPSLQFPKKVVIAGSRPNEELKELAAELPDVEIIDTPESMDPYFRAADLYVAPVFDGAGMKVKVAEAMSYGLPVAGTIHAFIGYEIEGIPGLYRCADAAEMIHAINVCAGMDQEVYRNTKTGIRCLFEEKYSMKRSIEVFRKMVESVTQ